MQAPAARGRRPRPSPTDRTHVVGACADPGSADRQRAGRSLAVFTQEIQKLLALHHGHLSVVQEFSRDLVIGA